MIKILLVEDEESIQKPLADHLSREGYKVILAPTGAIARQKLEENPDLIIMDWMLPDTQGIELLKEWRAQDLVTPAIMLTARTDLVDKVLGLELGANDYITKPFEVRELIARIRTHLRVHKNSTVFKQKGMLRMGDFKVLQQQREVHFKGELTPLTKTEYDLLILFLEYPNQVFSREELLKRVWGFDNYPTTRTVDTHILQLRQKFQNEIFETVHGIGYRLRIKNDKFLTKD